MTIIVSSRDNNLHGQITQYSGIITKMIIALVASSTPIAASAAHYVILYTYLFFPSINNGNYQNTI